MKVVLSRVLGYCMGVRRAVDLAFDALEANKKVRTFGELIHNNTVLDTLARRGVTIITSVDDTDDLSNQTVVLCAHGVPPETERALASRGAEIIDASCPMVKKSQTMAAAFAEKGTNVFLAGEKTHSEVIGIQGYNPQLIIVSNADEARAAARNLAGRSADAETALLAQTTISEPEFGLIADAIREFFPALRVCDTICGATAARQDALRELCGVVDVVVIAGSPGSSNSRRLLSIAQGSGKPAFLAETAAALPPGISRYKNVGLSAGASTPDEIINEIKNALENAPREY